MRSLGLGITNKDLETISDTFGESFLVNKIIDGDTLEVTINEKIEKVRLIGIDTPEIVDPKKSVECFGEESSNKATEMLLNHIVKFISDETQNDRDKYGRLLRYVYLEDGLFFNKWMIENGYAHEYTYDIPYKYQSEFKEAENYAKDHKLGLWMPEICNEVTEKDQMSTNNSVTSSEADNHVFYTSGYYTSELYYCDSDLVWKNLSERYLESYTSETTLLEKYPTKTLHEPCK
jgi:micrococcal nuclease